MIFSELYSAYYNAVAKIIKRMLSGKVTEKELLGDVKNNAFEESFMTVLPALKSGKWQLVTDELSTPLKNIPEMPLTTLQKRWLKSVTLDKRVKLFDVEFEGLSCVEPLFGEEDYYIYDKYSDGDPFEDEEYIKLFRFLIKAIREKTAVRLSIKNRSGTETYTKCYPVALEYSEKDDKFRLITSGCRYVSYVNLNRITKYGIFGGELSGKSKGKEKKYKTLILEISDVRSTCERCMLHFAHFEKEAEKLEEGKYLLKIKYEEDDEMEMVIRVLSFGPNVKAHAPDSLVELIKQKLKNQMICGIK